MISAIMSRRSSSSTPQTLRRNAMSRLASAGRFSIIACIAGSNRSRSISCSLRHSARLRKHAWGLQRLQAAPASLSNGLGAGAEPRGDLVDRPGQVSVFIWIASISATAIIRSTGSVTMIMACRV